MDKEKLMALWKREYEQSYYGWQFAPCVYDYFEGKTDTIGDPLLNGKKNYAWYHDWLVKELDGESGELARRMLVVISKIRRDGMISNSYSSTYDTEICLRMGYDFESVIKQSVIKFASIKIDDIYYIAGLLVKYLPDDSVEFANRLLGKDIDDMIEKRKADREIYLAVSVAIRLIQMDKERYKDYLPAINYVFEKLSGEYITILLYHSWTLSDDLKEKLVTLLSVNTAAAHFINARLKGKEMLTFLHDIGAPHWPYYYLVAVENIRTDDRQQILNDLYKEDKETFMKVYNEIATSNSPQIYVYAPYILSVLLINGEGKTELENLGVVLLGIFKKLLNEYSDEKNVDFSMVADESVALSDTPLSYRINRDFGWGYGELIIGAFSVLYDYSSRARRFIDYLLYFGNNKRASYNTLNYTAGYFMKSRRIWLGIPEKDSMKTLFQSEGGYTISDAFATYTYAMAFAGSMQNTLTAAITPEFVKENEALALQKLTDGLLGIDETQVWMDLLYKTCGITKYEPLIGLLSEKSKLVRKKAEEMISNNEEAVRPLLEEKMSKLKGEALSAAKRLIKRWDNERKYGANFLFSGNKMVIDFCYDNYDPDNSKYINWITEDMFTDVRFADLSEKAPAVVVKYIISEYMALEEPYKIKICDKVVETLSKQDFESVLENIYRLWMDEGAEAKKKMIMVPYCIYGSDSQILKLRQQLITWADASRGAIAAFVVNAIAMNGGSVALMMIDAIATKFPNKQVKNAAGAAFTFAAKALEVPEDVLSDKIVPTLGFNKEGEKILDYGSRTFTITLLPDFSLSIFDNDKQKVIKSMPSPAANDDVVKATAAKKEFAELKKQIKATVQAQTNRLEKVLVNGRQWTAKAWTELFVENPVMHRFATGLVWGVYRESNLMASFRYMDDGTFNTVDEEEYTMKDTASISLVHPIELAEDELTRWKEQLDDYEVVQPLPQLTAPIVKLEEKDLKGKNVIRYAAELVPSGKIAALAKKYNMVRGEVWDGGSYSCFHWVDKCLNIAAQLNFEYMYMGQEYNEEVTMGNVIFYRLGEDQATNDEPKDNVILEPGGVPERFVSSVIGVFDTLKG